MSVCVENTPRAWTERAAAGTSWQAALWSERGQTRRFRAVLSHLNVREGDSLLDYGCGTGRLSAFLPDGVEYHAYDWAEGMLERVGRDHPDAHTHESLPDLMFDHVVAVGPFNLEDGWSKQDTLDRIGDLWTGYVRRSLAVSLFRGRSDGHLSYTPQDLAGFAHTLGLRRYVIDGSYADNDLLLVAHR